MYQYGPGLGFLATVRPDGGPRLHPMCPIVEEGQLWAFILERSPKCGDLRRDGRYAMHAFPATEVDDELLLMGTAREHAADADLRARLAAATAATVGGEEEVLFSFDIDRAMVATYEVRGVFPPEYAVWRADKPT